MSRFTERVDEPQDARQVELETETCPQPYKADNADCAAIRQKTEACKLLFESCQTLYDNEQIDSLCAKFHWWSLGIGASKQGHASLDYRVRTRHDIREKIVSLLDKLTISLQVCHRIESNRSQQVKVTHVSHIESEYGHSDLEENLAYIRSNIKYLSRISAAIRKHGTKLRHKHVDKLLSEESVDLKEFSDYLKVLIFFKPTELGLGDVLQAYSETPPSLDLVLKRLIQANLVRRNRFNHYYKTYLRKNGRREKDGQSLMDRDDSEQEAFAQTHDTQLPSPIMSALVLQKEHISPKIALVDRSVTSSQTATEIGSFIMPERTHSRQATSTGSRVSRSVLRQDYPRCPVTEGGFWCPFCAQPLDSSYSDSKKSIKWRGHVLEDLSPYTCVYADCDQPDAMYATIDEWRRHLKSWHSISRWICDVCYLESSSPNDFIFDQEEQWRSHTLSCHSEELLIQDLDDISEESRRTVVPPVACPLCNDSAVLLQPDTDKHIADHLHSFSLQALPWETTSPDDDTQASRGSDTRKPLHIESEDEAEETDWSASYSVQDLEVLLNESISRCEYLSRSKDFEVLHETWRSLLETLHNLKQARSSLNVAYAGETANLMIRLNAIMSRTDDIGFISADMSIADTLDDDLKELLASIQTIASKTTTQTTVETKASEAIPASYERQSQLQLPQHAVRLNEPPAAPLGSSVYFPSDFNHDRFDCVENTDLLGSDDPDLFRPIFAGPANFSTAKNVAYEDTTEDTTAGQNTPERSSQELVPDHSLLWTIPVYEDQPSALSQPNLPSGPVGPRPPPLENAFDWQIPRFDWQIPPLEPESSAGLGPLYSQGFAYASKSTYNSIDVASSVPSSRFPSRIDLNRHTRIRNTPGLYAIFHCRCGVETPRKDNYVRHQKICVPKRYKHDMFICKCSSETSDKADHLEHIKDCPYTITRGGRSPGPRSGTASMIVETSGSPEDGLGNFDQGEQV